MQRAQHLSMMAVFAVIFATTGCNSNDSIIESDETETTSEEEDDDDDGSLQYYGNPARGCHPDEDVIDTIDNTHVCGIRSCVTDSSCPDAPVGIEAKAECLIFVMCMLSCQSTAECPKGAKCMNEGCVYPK